MIQVDQEIMTYEDESCYRWIFVEKPWRMDRPVVLSHVLVGGGKQVEHSFEKK